LHLAYNDIRNLESIAVLFQQQGIGKGSRLEESGGKNDGIGSCPFPQLMTLSLYGNPIVGSINYLSFFKMLIPTLRIIDDRDASEEWFCNNVCPQE
jgi:hypothetical protein